MTVTRRQWDEHMSAWFERYARSRWAAAEPYWGMWCIPQSRLPVLPAGLADVAVVELGCGSAYVSAWLARRGARPVGVDVSARQLAIAHRLQGEFSLRFPLVQADAERVPLGAGCADLVISEYGASVWCDPYRWIPEAPGCYDPVAGWCSWPSPRWRACACRSGGRPPTGWYMTCSGCTAWCGVARQAASTGCSRCHTGNGSGSWAGAA